MYPSFGQNVSSSPVPVRGNLEQSPGLSVADIFSALVRNKWLILTCVVVCLAVVTAYLIVKKPVYEASASVRIDPSRTGSLGLNELVSGNSADAGGDQTATEILILKSDAVALATLNSLSDSDFQAYAGFEKKSMSFNPSEHRLTPDQENMLGGFKLATTVKQVESTQVVTIAFRDRNPVLAATIVNHLVSSYFKQNFDSRFNSVAQVTTWLSSQMEDLKNRAAKAQRNLAAFQEANSILGTDASSNTTIDRLKLLNDRLTVAEGDRIMKEAQMRAAASGDPSVLVSLMPDANLQALETQRGNLAAQYAQMSTKFGTGYPPLADLKQQIALVKEKIAQDVSAISARLKEEYDASSRSETMLRYVYGKETEKAYALNRTQADYAVLVAEGASSRELYEKIQAKLQQASVDAGLNAVNTMLVDFARPPLIPVEPKKGLLLAFGLALGLAVGSGAALLRASMSDDVLSASQLEGATGLYHLASIPHKQSSDALVTISDPRSRNAEAYRSLRNAMLLSSREAPPKTTLMTSGLSGEGRSVTAANYAVVLAQMGHKVLLLDGDLQSPKLHEFFGVSNAAGLGQELTLPGSGMIVSPVKALPNLHLLPGGANIAFPSEVLGSSKFHSLLETWKAEYDSVVIDSAPLLLVSDSLPLAKWADAVILIARFGVTPLKALQQAKNLLDMAQARVAGVIINDMEKSADDFASSGRGK